MSSNRISSDWTLSAYRTLCECILECGYRTQSIDDYLSDSGEPVVILRHDVDRIPVNAVAMAELEAELGIRSTYYVRTVPSVYKPTMIARLHELGHEVGYHYEVVTKTKGDVDRALELFAKELSALRELAPITTASAHGSPLSPWSNQLVWDKVSPAAFDLRAEAYRDIDYTTVGYYTDTGRTWAAQRTNLRDRVDSGSRTYQNVHTTAELCELLANRIYPALCVQTHPERWNGTTVGYARSYLFDLAANTVKTILRSVRG